MAAVAVEIVRNQIRQYLPSGAFWDQPGVQRDAANRFVNAVADAMLGDGSVIGDTPTNPGLVEFISCLNIYMRPETTPYRSVLLQWYEYLAIPSCVAIPEDLEDLRAIVVGAATSASVNTPDGLRSWINATLPTVEVSESLPLLLVPVVAPSPGDGWWAVVEIWFSPLLDDAETVLCVARPVVRGSNDIRLVSPNALWTVNSSNPPVVRGDEVALTWSAQRADTDLKVQRFSGIIELEAVILPSVTPDDGIIGSDLFPLVGPATDVQGEQWTLTANRTYSPGTLQTLVESVNL